MQVYSFEIDFEVNCDLASSHSNSNGALLFLPLCVYLVGLGLNTHSSLSCFPFKFDLMYVALSDPGVIWGQKYHLCLFAWKLKFGDWNHQRCFPWWQKMQKSAEKWSKKTFLHFLALWPRVIWSIFTPYVCYLEGISTMWATPYVVKYLN